MKNSIRPQHSLSFERLEDRSLLAGNVVASTSLGNLTITGDADANEISVYQTAPGCYKLVGNNGSTVNGAADAMVSEVTGKITICMQGGADYVALQLVAPGDLEIHMGTGRDVLALGGYYEQPSEAQSLSCGVEVLGDLTVDMGDGEDIFNAFNSRVVGAADMRSGADFDSVLLHDTAFLSSLFFDCNAGADVVEIDRITVAGNAMFQTSTGADGLNAHDSTFLGTCRFQGGDGSDTLTLSGNTYALGVTYQGFETVLED